MSFILDALRKSEHERQRQTGPGLVEVAVAAPKPKTNRWAPAAIALLLVNLVAIGVLLLLKSGDEPTATAEPASAPAGEPVPAPVTAAAPAATTSAPSPQATVTQTLPETPPMLNPAPALPVTPAAGNPLEREVQSYAPAMEPEAATAAATPPPGPAAVQSARRGSVVYQSLPEADPVGAYPPPASHTGSGAPANMPRADDMAARGGFPEMKLELHVYSNVPGERIVFINGHRYKAGDTTAEGASVEEITQDGVIMSMGGNRFLLPRD